MNLLWRSTQAGRRGVTRNLVGRESVARVRIPSPPPEKAPFGVLFQLNPPLRVGEIVCDDEIPCGDEIRLDAGWVDLISSEA